MCVRVDQHLSMCTTVQHLLLHLHVVFLLLLVLLLVTQRAYRQHVTPVPEFRALKTDGVRYSATVSAREERLGNVVVKMLLSTSLHTYSYCETCLAFSESVMQVFVQEKSLLL